jgi:adenine-specific DNA glycosylase
MELGALICLPARPLCGECPAKLDCAAFLQGIQESLPPPRVRPATVLKERTLLIVLRRGRVLLVPSPRVKGFWDLPEPFETARLGASVGSFGHSITTSRYRFEVREARAAEVPDGALWWDLKSQINLSTATKKALKCLQSSRG